MTPLSPPSVGSDTTTHPPAAAPFHEADAWVQRVLALLLIAGGLAGILFLTGLSMIVAERDAQVRERLTRTGRTTTAQVISARNVNHRDVTITYRFTVPEPAGGMRSFTGTGIADAPAPEQVLVVYDPANPRVSRSAQEVAQPASQQTGFGPDCLPLPLVILGVVLWYRSRQPWQQARALTQQGRIATGVVQQAYTQRVRQGRREVEVPCVTYTFDAQRTNGSWQPITKHEQLVSDYHQREAIPGASVVVRYLPTHPQCCRLEPTHRNLPDTNAVV